MSEKRFHFCGWWKNGEHLVICSYGKNRKDAYIKMLKAKKEKKFIYNRGDNFHMTTECEEDHPNPWKFGHTQYIVQNGKVYIN